MDYPVIPAIAKKKRVAIDVVAISSVNPFNMCLNHVLDI